MNSSKPKSNYRLTLLLVFCLLGGLILLRTLPDVRRLLPIWSNGMGIQPSRSVEPLRVRTRDDTTVTFTVHYEGCGHSEPDAGTRPPRPLTGLLIEDFRRLYPDWQITEFSEQRVSLRRIAPGMCPDDTRYRLLTIRDNKVVVFYGSGKIPGSPLMKVTDIPVSSLSKSDREMLGKGIVLNSDQEVADWLEGLNE